MKEIKIGWQRLITGGQTCPRCGSTEKELDKAVAELKKQGVNVTLNKSEISLYEFNKNPLESNRIFLNSKSLEELLKGTTGKSRCCSVCGDYDCRTTEINGMSYEIITSEMIIEAAMKVIKLA